MTRSSADNFKAIYIAENIKVTVENAENAGIVQDEDGNFVIETAAVPKIIAGANSTWVKGSGKGLSFTSDADFSDFIAVYVDNTALIKDTDYTVAEGSTIVTLQPNYLEKLSAGNHTIGIQSKGGTASANFTVKTQSQGTTDGQDNASTQKTQTTVKTPKTGDTNQYAVWIALMAAAVLVLAGTALYRRKR